MKDQIAEAWNRNESENEKDDLKMIDWNNLFSYPIRCRSRSQVEFMPRPPFPHILLRPFPHHFPLHPHTILFIIIITFFFHFHFFSPISLILFLYFFQYSHDGWTNPTRVLFDDRIFSRIDLKYLFHIHLHHSLYHPENLNFSIIPQEILENLLKKKKTY